MSERYKNISQLAEMFDKDRATVRKKLKDVKPYRVEAKQTFYDVVEAAPLLCEPKSENIEKELEKEQLRYEKARADKVELEVARTKELQVPIENVKTEVNREYTRVRAAILAISNKLAKPISMVSDPSKCKDMIDELIKETLDHLQKDAQEELKLYESESKESTSSDSDEDPEGSSEA